MDITFIIVNYNTFELTLECICSVYQYTKVNSFEIILVDNASTDGSVKNISARYPDLTFILNEENIGFGRANNLGIQMAKGKYVFLLNSDTLLTSDAANTFLNYMEDERHLRVACCGAALIDGDGNDQVSYGNFPSLTEAFSALGFLKLYKQYYNRYLSSGVFNYSDEIRAVDYICGADMFIRKVVLDKIGGFDPRFFLYFEEVDLSLRIKKANYLSVLLPGVKIIHYESASVGGTALNYGKARHLARSRRLYFRKNHGKLVAMVINKIYAMQALVFLIVKNNRAYLRMAVILFKA